MITAIKYWRRRGFRAFSFVYGPQLGILYVLIFMIAMTVIYGLSIGN